VRVNRDDAINRHFNFNRAENEFRNLRIGVHLGGGFVLVLLLLLCVAGSGLVHMSQIQGRLNEIAKKNNREDGLAAKMNFTIDKIKLCLSNARQVCQISTDQY
jgi:hypothetical protein